MTAQIPGITYTTTAVEVGTWRNIPHTGRQARKRVKNMNQMRVLKKVNSMNAYEIAEVIAEYLVDNKDLTIAVIKDNDKETLQDEIYAELTEE